MRTKRPTKNAGKIVVKGQKERKVQMQRRKKKIVKRWKMEEINCSTRETQECSAQLHEKEEEEVKLKAIRGEHEDDI